VRDACTDQKIAVKKTRPYRPQTNGKAGRFIRTMLVRRAYAYTYENESARLAALAPALDFYNRFRPHRALKGLTPLQRVNNVPGTNI
jgi:transposase InsO family protein